MSKPYTPSVEQVRQMPVEVQIAVLFERVDNMGDELRAVKKALWAVVGSILGGAMLFLFSIAVGWIGPHPPGPVQGAIKAVWGLVF